MMSFMQRQTGEAKGKDSHEWVANADLGVNADAERTPIQTQTLDAERVKQSSDVRRVTAPAL